MRVLAIAVLACVAAMALADGYRPGFKKTKNAIVAAYNNADRQEAVNDKARYVGSGTGTERYDGVPGTGLDFGYHGRRSYGYDRRYGYDRYDDGYYGEDRYDDGYYGDDRYDDRYNGYGHRSYGYGQRRYGYDRHEHY